MLLPISKPVRRKKSRKISNNTEKKTLCFSECLSVSFLKIIKKFVYYLIGLCYNVPDIAKTEVSDEKVF